MLEVRNLSKIYKTKNGVDVKALDSVSLSFPETGMVFLLGKSGSGKSTLLNVCGGLDSPTGGEVIVKGRSSKDFSSSDFDSYRNTFVGFIFQEYYILNEFTVEDNVALALELQGKSKDKEAIAALLEDVDLAEFAKRKPNTLSGGQKQRIAIARALVKAPEIIMADEPTGALDSATGKQVFDTLKKLSRDKLIVVVSHDRDFAEQYGDRIIELKDGKIISDISKTHEQQQSLSANVTAVGDTLCVKSGSLLTDTDFDEIKAFLKASRSDVLIAAGEGDVKAFKSIARITDSGEKEVFKATDEKKLKKRAYTPEESRFIRSKLPMRHAMKIGLSGLKTKPIRLFFTVLLCTVALILFGLLSTMMFYDSESTLYQTLTDSSFNTLRLIKTYKTHEKSYHNGSLEFEHESIGTGLFSPEDIEGYAEKFGADAFGAIATHGVSFTTQSNSNYWSNELSYFAYLPTTNTLRSDITRGRYPESDDEICISSFIANSILNLKLFDTESGSALEINTVEDVLNKNISIGGYRYKIVGIIEAGEIDAKYDSLKDSTASDNYSLRNSFSEELGDGLHLVGFVTEDKLTELARNNIFSHSAFDSKYICIISEKNDDGSFVWPSDSNYYNGQYGKISDFSYQILWLTDVSSLSDTQAVIHINNIANLYSQYISEYSINASNEYHQAYNDKYSDNRYKIESDIANIYMVSSDNPWGIAWETLIAWENGNNYPSEASAELYAVFTEWQEYWSVLTPYKANKEKAEMLYESMNCIRDNGYFDYSDPDNVTFVELTPDEKTRCADQILAFVKEQGISAEVSAKLFNMDVCETFGAAHNFNVVGFYDDNASAYEWRVLLSDNKYDSLWDTHKMVTPYYHESTTKYVAAKDAIYSTVFIPYDHSDSATRSIMSIYANESFDENDTRIELNCSLTGRFNMVDSTITEMSKIFLYVGIVMAAFAALLLSNFISVSISHKKKDIGILRAVGARGSDVFKIFFSESFAITFICVILSTIGSIALCEVLNAELGQSIGVSLFVFGILPLLVLVGVAAVTVLVSTFLPVYNAAKKQPIDSIKAL